MANGLLEIQDPATTARLLEHEQAARLAAEAEQAQLSKVYSVQTLAIRLEVGESSAYDIIRSGKIRYVCCGKKNYRVSELAVRQYLGDKPPT